MKALPFNKWRKYGVFIFTFFTVLSIICIAVKGFNFSIDFTGGVIFEFKQSGEEINTAEVRNAIKLIGINDFSVQTTTDGITIIKIGGKSDGNLVNLPELIRQTLSTQFANTNIEVIKTDFVSPTIGKELAFKVLIAVLVSLVAILLYIGVRFELRYSVGGILSSVQDVIITIGFISLFAIPFDITTIAAILTVLGYSINDSVVIFDRIRDNFKVFSNKNNDFIIENALNKTLSRTITTSFTTLLAIFAIILIGGSILRPFALIIFFGIFVGTLSSIFIAPTFLYNRKHTI
jgi:preprotein translocase SecF subunit